MGLQNQLSDVSPDSPNIIILAVLIAKSASYLSSFFFAIVHALGIYSPRLDDLVGPGLAGATLLCERISLNTNQSDGSDCAVCLNRMCSGDHVPKLACRHVFHKECLDSWLAHMNFSCPLCRRRVL